MMPWKTWLVRLGVAGALVIVAGCGSSDVPDPGSDSAAAEPPSDGAPPPAVPPVHAPAAEAQVATEEGAAKSEESKPEEAPAQAEAPAASTSTPDQNSATAEMLAIATTPQPGANTPPANGESTSGGGSGPGGAQGPPGAGGMSEMQKRMQAGGGRGGMGMMAPGMGPNGSGRGGPPDPGDMAKMQAQMQSGMRNQMQAQAQMREQMQGQAGRGPGGPGMAGGRGGPGGGSDKEPDFHDPRMAVQAFLDAVKDKDLDRITEATAIRAQVEAAKKNQELFKRIYDGSLSESELDDLAGKLEGFRIISENPPKSSGRIQVIISKRDRNATINRVVTVRHEKGGWKVCDVSGPGTFKNPVMPGYGQPKFGGSKNN
jgi:hypothetical protein